MDTGSADILSACGLEARVPVKRVPVKPWLELSLPRWMKILRVLGVLRGEASFLLSTHLV